MVNTNTATNENYKVSAIFYDNTPGNNPHRRLSANAKAISDAAKQTLSLELKLTQVHRLDTPVCNDLTLLDEAVKGGYDFYVISCQAAGCEDAYAIVSEMLRDQGIPTNRLIVLANNHFVENGYTHILVSSGNGYLVQHEANLVVDKMQELLNKK